MRCASTATSAACRAMPTAGGRSPAFAAFRPGCGATPRCSSSSSGCARHNAARRRPSGSASTASTCTACSARSTRCSPTSIARTRGGRAGAASLRLLRRLPRGRPGLRLRHPLRHVAELRGRGRGAASRAARRRAPPQAALDAGGDDDARFHAEQNARLVKNAERYYRTMFGSRVASWNLRDSHMVETLEACAAISAPPRRAAAHRRLGAQLAPGRRPRHRARRARRVERRPAGARAARRRRRAARLLHRPGHGRRRQRLGRPARDQAVRPGLPGSWEALFHDTGIARFALPLRGDACARPALDEPRLQRAIGVIYRPETERQSHYFLARPARQFDAIVHLDRTRAVEPLDRREPHPPGEPPETWPSGV